MHPLFSSAFRCWCTTGGAADNVADIYFLARLLYFWISGSGDTLEGNEGIFFLCRLIFTLLGPLVLLFFIIDGVWMMKTANNEAKGRVHQKKTKKCRRMNGPGLVIFIFLVAFLVKAGFVVLRFVLIGTLIYMQARPERVTKKLRVRVDTWEMLFAIDFLWSSLWLGIITLTEWMVVGAKDSDLPFGLEVWKLSALALDLIGVSYFFVIVIFFDQKICGLDKKHEHDPDVANEQQRLLNDVEKMGLQETNTIQA